MNTIIDIGGPAYRVITATELLSTYQVANLPAVNINFSQHFAKRAEYFENERYRPTGERAELYREVPPGPDFCSLKAVDEQDLISAFLTKHLNFIYDTIRHGFARLRGVETTTPLRYIDSDSIDGCMHLLAAVVVPFILSSTFGALSALDSEGERIVVLGFLCSLLCFCVILVTPKLRRDSLFAIAAAYFAVGGVYIGSRSRNGP